jgi:hypothetical protein
MLACSLVVLLAERPAYAYIDPNAAGLVSQILTPVLVFAAAGLTFFRKRIGDLFSGISRRFGRKDDTEHAQQD